LFSLGQGATKASEQSLSSFAPIPRRNRQTVEFDGKYCFTTQTHDRQTAAGATSLASQPSLPLFLGFYWMRHCRKNRLLPSSALLPHSIASFMA
jgi:hypothetical protein